MSKEDMLEYWGLDTPVAEGEAKRKALLKELEKARQRGQGT